MKKAVVYLFLITCIGMSSCEDNTSSEELNFNAPNGDKLAIEDVNLWAAKVVSKKFDSTATFKITNIQYHKFDDGYGAIISFEVNGESSSFMMRKNTTIGLNARTEQDPCPNWLVYCLGAQCCAMNYNAPSGNITCSCQEMGAGCHLELECVREN